MIQPDRLVLFDIDGTILHGGKLWVECFRGAMHDCFPGVDFPKISFSGKTDRQICRELMAAAGLLAALDESGVEAQIDTVIRDYLDRVRAQVPHRGHEVKLLAGVEEVVRELQKMDNVVLGLLTGNVREGATLKLSVVQMERYFTFGVFGDDHWDRYQLPAIARDRMEQEKGWKFNGKQIVIIGDTVHDVNCGRSLGVRTIAVGTGQQEQRAHILAAQPDYFFEDLSDTQLVLRAILEE